MSASPEKSSDKTTGAPTAEGQAGAGGDTRAWLINTHEAERLKLPPEKRTRAPVSGARAVVEVVAKVVTSPVVKPLLAFGTFSALRPVVAPYGYAGNQARHDAAQRAAAAAGGAGDDAGDDAGGASAPGEFELTASELVAVGLCAALLTALLVSLLEKWRAPIRVAHEDFVDAVRRSGVTHDVVKAMGAREGPAPPGAAAARAPAGVDGSAAAAAPVERAKAAPGAAGAGARKRGKRDKTKA